MTVTHGNTERVQSELFPTVHTKTMQYLHGLPFIQETIGNFKSHMHGAKLVDVFHELECGLYHK